MPDAEDTQLCDDARLWVVDRMCLYDDVDLVVRRAQTIITTMDEASAEDRDQWLVEFRANIQRLRDVLRIATGLVPQTQPPLPLNDAVLSAIQETPDAGGLKRFREHLADIERHVVATAIDREWSDPYRPAQYQKWIGEARSESVPVNGSGPRKVEPLPKKTWQRMRIDADRRGLLIREHNQSCQITLSLAKAWGIAHLMPDWQ